MMRARRTIVYLSCAGLAACASTADHSGTLSQLESVPADVADIHVADGLERAAESYRRYLEETPESARTPEAMRRLADLQIEQTYGVMGTGDIMEMAAPDTATPTQKIVAQEPVQASRPSQPLSESDEAFVARVTEREQLLAATSTEDPLLPGESAVPVPTGPREAIKTYWEILETYPNYERNDQVLYQLSRAYDEIGEPDQAMEVMDRFVAEYPYSRFIDEVYFRRGEYYFVRKKFLDAEDAYGSLIRMGASSDYYELALYKLGWALYKQEMYKEALHRYMSMLDHRLAIGYDFDAEYDEEQEHRLADTFRVISLSFSNLGGADVLNEYFASNGHRSYADKIYGNLAEFYFSKLRYDDATSVYKSFVGLNPYHKVSPHFGMRVVEIYAEAGFPKLVVEAKKDFASRYAIDAEYWNFFPAESSPEVTGFLKQNLTDLAGHYHALYQEPVLVHGEKPANFNEASRWYRQFLVSFPADTEIAATSITSSPTCCSKTKTLASPATEYERTAYEYDTHETILRSRLRGRVRAPGEPEAGDRAHVSSTSSSRPSTAHCALRTHSLNTSRRRWYLGSCRG